MQISIDCQTGEITRTAYVPPVIPLEDRKIQMLEDVRTFRWVAETGGTNFEMANGSSVRIRTDEGSQSKIAGAIALFDKDPTLTVIDFETQPGAWISLDQATMEAIGVAVGRHIQSCFSHARFLSEFITNETTGHSELNALQISQDWPGQAPPSA